MVGDRISAGWGVREQDSRMFIFGKEKSVNTIYFI